MSSSSAGPSANSILDFADRVDISSIEQRLPEGPAFIADPALGVVRLSEATDFDSVGLLRLLSLAASRHKAGRTVRFELPRDPYARHVLRRSRFAAAAEMVLRTPFRLLVKREDLAYFGEDAPPQAVTPGEHSALGSVVSYLAEQGHFGLSPYQVDARGGLTRMLDEEVARWRSYAMVELLAKVLRRQAIDVSRVIVQELVANVVEHPLSSVAVIASQLKLPGSGERESGDVLTIAAWDDGTSIIETLRRRLNEVSTVRAWSPEATDTFAVVRMASPGGPIPYRSDWTPGPTASDEELLLASLFPGITRKVASNSLDPPSHATPGTDYGYGLFALYKTVIDYFSGSIELQCGRTTLRLTRATETEAYRAEMTTRENFDSLSGTFVTVNLPAFDD